MKEGDYPGLEKVGLAWPGDVDPVMSGRRGISAVQHPINFGRDFQIDVVGIHLRKDAGLE